MSGFPSLYAIADAGFGDPVQLSKALFEGGARIVQVRNKNGSARELLRQVEAILAIAPGDARVIVNDRVDVALVSGASGVHLGQTDLPAHHARKILGPSCLIGVSTHNLQQALAAGSGPADYIASGPVFPTSTKSNPEPVIGLEGLREICSRVSKPVVAIGGIRMEHVSEVMACGAAAVAVIRDLLSAADVASRTRQWIRQDFSC